jgi:hypothetical protein
MRLFRAVTALLGGQQANLAQGKVRDDTSSLLTWLERRASLAMPELPGWE